ALQSLAIACGCAREWRTGGAHLAVGKIATQNVKPCARESLRHGAQERRLAIRSRAVRDNQALAGPGRRRLMQPASNQLAFKTFRKQSLLFPTRSGGRLPSSVRFR